MKYVLNSAVITAPGFYQYNLISREVAYNWLLEDSQEWESCIGYQETADALTKLTGIQVPVSRKIIKMKVDDEALVFRLVFPQGYRPDPTQKGGLGTEFILTHCEMGLLRRLA